MIEVQNIRVIEGSDNDPDTSYLDQEGFEERLEEYQRGGFEYIGIYAECLLIVNGTRQVVRSPGLWGIESDSGRQYLDEVGREEIAELWSILLEMGVSREAIEAT